MLQLITDFPNHLLHAAAICSKAQLKSHTNQINNVLITGLGGSGIGGSIVADYAAKHSQVPILVNKDYHIPAFVNKNTLVIACSYSGNTEETLMAMAESLEAGAQVAIVTSGGMILERAKQAGLNAIVVPGGNPPRSMLGYSLVALMHYMRFYNILQTQPVEDWQTLANYLLHDQATMQEQSKQLAEKIAHKTVAVYAASGMAGIATRWRQQLNENAKVVGWDAAVPEMNHNELVGWAGGNNNHAAIFLRSNHDYSRNQTRMDISKEIILRKTDLVFDIWAKQNTSWAEALYLIHWGDWLSYYLHEIHQVDIMDIVVIDYLKNELSKI